MPRNRSSLSLALPYAIASVTFAQPTPPADPPSLRIESALLSATTVSVEFSAALKNPGPQLDLAQARFKNAPTVRASLIAPSSLEDKVLTITLPAPIATPANVEVCFARVTFIAADKKTYETTEELCRAISTDIASAKRAALEKLTNTPTTSTERDIFASGFVTTATSGSVGGADISLNPDLKIPNLNTFLNIKKTTAEEGDPRHFEAGVRFRGVLPWWRGTVRRMASLPLGASLNAAIREQQKKLIAGALLDFAVKLEGDPTNFGVSNTVGETALHVRTLTKAFAGKKGYWRGFLMPLAFEGGRSLSDEKASNMEPAMSDNPMKVNWIARYKAGAGMTFLYDNPENQLPVRRVELDMNVTMRNLLLHEATYNSATMLVDSTGKGVRGYGQVDLKFYIGESPAGRYGLKLTYNRGSLPPVFARVKSFQFGFLFESKNGEEDAAASENRATARSRLAAPPSR